MDRESPHCLSSPSDPRAGWLLNNFYCLDSLLGLTHEAGYSVASPSLSPPSSLWVIYSFDQPEPRHGEGLTAVPLGKKSSAGWLLCSNFFWKLHFLRPVGNGFLAFPAINIWFLWPWSPCLLLVGPSRASLHAVLYLLLSAGTHACNPVTPR